MNRTVKICLIVLLALLFIGGIWFFFFVRSSILDGPGMVNDPQISSFSYIRGGGSLGDYCSFDLKDGQLRMEKREAWNLPTTTKTVTSDPALSQHLKEIIDRYNMSAWGELPDSDLIVYDAPSTSLTILFDSGLELSFSSSKALPNDGWDALNEIRDTLEAEFGN